MKVKAQAAGTLRTWRLHATRLLALLLVCFVALQLSFVARVGLMQWLDPASTSFQRSEAWRLLLDKPVLKWRQAWVSGSLVATSLKRAVLASEDAAFTDHNGVEWDAIEKAWQKNEQAQARAQRQVTSSKRPAPAKVVGGSTITQQLAKNLFLSGERTAFRKAQEFVITLALEALLGKQRILEIYLNSVEWGEGVFGAEAAAQHYFRAPAARLSIDQSARLAVMLPAPKRFEKQPASAYVLGRAAVIAARMPGVALP
jgi:monofunctional glycosyltransferase